MNPTAIEWTHIFGPGSGFTFNPIVGCSFGCPYCYARRQAKRQKHNCRQCYEFTPHLHEERLNQPIQRRKPAGIFLGSMTDLYGPEVPQEWRDRVWQTCDLTPQHQYFVLTKQPQNVTDAAQVPRNVLLGISAHSEEIRSSRFAEIIRRVLGGGMRNTRFMLSLEPLQGPMSYLLGVGDKDWVVVGAQTGPGAVVPERAWVDEIVAQGRVFGFPVFVKDNLRALYPDADWPQEWPQEVTQ